MKKKEDSKRTSFVFTGEAAHLLALLAGAHGLSKTGVIEMLIRQEARRLKLSDVTEVSVTNDHKEGR